MLWSRQFPKVFNVFLYVLVLNSVFREIRKKLVGFQDSVDLVTCSVLQDGTLSAFELRIRHYKLESDVIMWDNALNGITQGFLKASSIETEIR